MVLFQHQRARTSNLGPFYEPWGISRRLRVTKLLVDKRNAGNAGKAMPADQISRKHGADPPRVQREG